MDDHSFLILALPCDRLQLRFRMCWMFSSLSTFAFASLRVVSLVVFLWKGRQIFVTVKAGLKKTNRSQIYLFKASSMTLWCGLFVSREKKMQLNDIFLLILTDSQEENKLLSEYTQFAPVKPR